MNQQTKEKYQDVPLLDILANYKEMREELENTVIEVMRSGQYVLGPYVLELERKIAAYCQTDYAVGVASGSDALLLSLMALNVGQGDEVITTPFTFFATAGSISRLGAKPVFVDIDPATFNLLPDQVEAKITDRAKAVIPVHLFGQCADMDRIIAIAKKHDLTIIEDAAQAIGAQYKGRKAGSMGEFGCFSFFPSKNLGGMGDGGMITCNSEKISRDLIILREHGSAPESRYNYQRIGCNNRLDALQAAILKVKLPHLDGWHETRRKNAALYDHLLADVPQVKTPVSSPDCCHIFNQYSLLVENRDELRSFLAQRNIASAIYYPKPLHLQDCFLHLGYRRGELPNTEKTCEKIISIPIYPGLTEEMINRVAKTIRKFYRV